MVNGNDPARRGKERYVFLRVSLRIALVVSAIGKTNAVFGPRNGDEKK